MSGTNWGFLALTVWRYDDSALELWEYLTTQHQQLNNRTTIIGAKFAPADQVLRKHAHTASDGTEMTITVAYDPVDDLLYMGADV